MTDRLLRPRRGGRGGGVKFSKRHDFKGVNFTNAQNVRGGRNIKTED